MITSMTNVAFAYFDNNLLYIEKDRYRKDKEKNRMYANRSDRILHIKNKYA